ncbi:MAG TPA: SDR family NAD(P)-dependent oxidoreductase [Roseiarcus sp.]|nr:SDR family NAD(P)-dependent oxidoreductase [Roseiarcus sp.]
MRDFQGRTAFITGGAGGFGRAFAKALLADGANVALVDLDERALARAVEDLGGPPDRVLRLVCDVSDRNALERAAGEAIRAFGRVHLVFNNAGVGGRNAGLEELTTPDWEWVIHVNLMSVAHGVAVFLPHLRGHGEGGHFVNTASMAGMLGQPHMGPYSATKAAVVSLSETLFHELKGTNVGVSVLCPGFAKTGIADERPNPLAPEAPPPSKAGAERTAQVRLAVQTGLDPAEVAARTLQGIRDDDLYIFTHPDMRPWLDKRLDRIRAAYDKAERFAPLG